MPELEPPLLRSERRREAPPACCEHRCVCSDDERGRLRFGASWQLYCNFCCVLGGGGAEQGGWSPRRRRRARIINAITAHSGMLNSFCAVSSGAASAATAARLSVPPPAADPLIHDD